MTRFDPKLEVQVVDDEIVVTLPGSYYSVTYYKPKNASHLLAKSIADRDDPRIPMTAGEFLAPRDHVLSNIIHSGAFLEKRPRLIRGCRGLRWSAL